MAAALACWCVLAKTAAAQEASPTFQPFFRLGSSPDYRDSNRSQGPSPSDSAESINQAFFGPYRASSSLQSGFNEFPVGDDIRYADDFNGNGDYSVSVVRADIDGDGVVEAGEIIGSYQYIGDLYTYNVDFEEINVAFSRDLTSLELMKQLVLFGDATTNSHGAGWRFDAFHNEWSAGFGEEVRGAFGIAPERVEAMEPSWRRDLAEQARFSLYSTAGLRSLFVNDDFSFDARGSILGRASVQQEIDHYVVGPQLGLGAVAEASMFRFEAVALGLVGYGRVENRQHGKKGGRDAFPGALNRPANKQPSYSSHRSDDEQVAWHGETRLTGSCQFTQNLRFDATWRWFVTGPIHDAPGSVVYSAPNYGFQQTNGAAEYGNDWFLGVTYTR